MSINRGQSIEAELSVAALREPLELVENVTALFAAHLCEALVELAPLDTTRALSGVQVIACSWDVPAQGNSYYQGSIARLVHR